MRKDVEFQLLRALQHGLLFLPDNQEAGRIQTEFYRNLLLQTA